MWFRDGIRVYINTFWDNGLFLDCRMSFQFWPCIGRDNYISQIILWLKNKKKGLETNWYGKKSSIFSFLTFSLDSCYLRTNKIKGYRIFRAQWSFTSYNTRSHCKNMFHIPSINALMLYVKVRQVIFWVSFTDMD